MNTNCLYSTVIAAILCLTLASCGGEQIDFNTALNKIESGEIAKVVLSSDEMILTDTSGEKITVEIELMDKAIWDAIAVALNKANENGHQVIVSGEAK